MKFTEHLRNRGEGKETGVPWFLHDKLRCYDFCNTVGLPTVNVLRKWKTPYDISLKDLPDKFVIKPNYQSSSIGVMVLERDPDWRYHDSMTGKDFSEDEVIAKQQKIYDESKHAEKLTIVEERITDPAGRAIPPDYKAYAFQGEIAFILEMDRNGGRTRPAWFDGNFNPLPAGRVNTAEKYLTLKEAVRPQGWESLLSLAFRASVAAPTPFASIDMYLSDRGAVLGEVTLVPGGFYFGKYFQPSEGQDFAAGWMWERALAKLGK